MKKILIVLLTFMLSLSLFAEDSGFISSVADFIATAPYLLNIGCEPSANHGARTFGSLEYKWTPDFSSQIYFEKGSDFAFEESFSDIYGDRTFTTDTGDYFCKIFPYKKYFIRNKRG